VKAQLDALRAAIVAHLDTHKTFKPSPSSASTLPAVHWRDTYAANRHLTSVPITADPRQRPDFTMALYSPSTQPSNWSDSLLYRFLSARKNNADAAADMFIGYCAWREKYGVDDLSRQQPMPFDEIIESFLAHRMHSTDKDGRVIYIQRTGLINPSDFLARVNDDVLVLTHTHFVERCMVALQASSVARGQRVSKMVNVIDTTGFTLSHARMVKIFRYSTYIDQNYYPEMLGAFYMVRSHPHTLSMFQAAFETAAVLVCSAVRGLHPTDNLSLALLVLRAGASAILPALCICHGTSIPRREDAGEDTHRQRQSTQRSDE